MYAYTENAASSHTLAATDKVLAIPNSENCGEKFLPEATLPTWGTSMMNRGTVASGGPVNAEIGIAGVTQIKFDFGDLGVGPTGDYKLCYTDDAAGSVVAGSIIYKLLRILYSFRGVFCNNHSSQY